MPGSIIASEVFGLVTSAGALAPAGMAVAFAINLVASRIIASAASPNTPTETGNPGNRQQVPPAGSNKLPVVYGSAYVGGIITDLTISNDNQTMYYCLALSEVTNTQSSSGDVFTFGNVYWGGKRCVFDGTDQTKVVSLLDESTGESQTNVNGNLFIYLYRNGSNQPTNSSTSAISLMSSSGLTYTWDANKLMSNCAFAIVKIVYNSDAGLTGIQQTRFQINNPRFAPGDCFSDFLQSTRYGAGIPSSQIDSTSLTALNTYCSGSFTYTPYSGGSSTITRFRFDGVIDTDQTVLTNMQNMASSCDCLLRYNELTAKWGVIVQSPTYAVAMALNDSNMISGIQIVPTDLSSTPNIIESKFANGTEKDTFASAVFSLSQTAPSLLYPNEPVNKQSITLPLVNSDIRAQYIAQRLLKAGREDLIVKVSISYAGLQLEAGDIVTVTSTNYGWTNKLFRISQVTETFTDDGQITASLTLLEYNASVYDDVSITQFTPAPNTGIPSPLVFGTMYAPTIVNQLPNAAIPSFGVSVTASSTGVSQYAEVWYSAYSNPSSSQRIFAGTTAIQSSGNPYSPSTSMGVVTLSNIPQGNWYFFVRMANSLGVSQFSAASSVLQWRPTTYQYSSRYVVVAYATSITGTGFSLSPRSGATYFGIYNSNVSSVSTNPSDYTWYLASTAFNTNNYLLFINYGNYLVGFSVGTANYATGTGAFVPSDTAIYDQSTWLALPDGYNVIDLNSRTGQIIQTGTTTVGTGEIAITNNSQGQIVASLAQLLNFGTGVYTKTSSVATLTIDIYGRVVGFTTPDNFYYTMTAFTATSGQTVFNVTRASGYITGQCWVFKNGLILDTSEYTDSFGTVTLGTGAIAGDIVTVISFRSVSSTTGTYASFSRNAATLSNQASYTASGFTLVSGNELLFLNGTVVNAQDYNISGQTITFVQTVTGDLQVIQWTNNNLGVPNGTPVNTDIFTTAGQALYSFSFDPNAFNLYNNGVLLLETVDYSVTTGSYTLAQTPTSNLNILVQETFQRTGAA